MPQLPVQCQMTAWAMEERHWTGIDDFGRMGRHVGVRVIHHESVE